MKSCKECGKEGCLLNQTEGYCLDCPECGVNWKEKKMELYKNEDLCIECKNEFFSKPYDHRDPTPGQLGYCIKCDNCLIKETKMEFDKSRVFTSLNADELKAGDKVIVADQLSVLKQRVQKAKENSAVVLHKINGEDWGRRFGFKMSDYALAYLVERAENCTNCDEGRWDVEHKKILCDPVNCGNGNVVFRNHEIEVCEYWKPKTEQKTEKKCGDCGNAIDEEGNYCSGDEKHHWVDQTGEKKCWRPKAEPHYRPFKDIDELIEKWWKLDGWSKAEAKYKNDKLRMPLIWLKNKYNLCHISSLVTGFFDNKVIISGEKIESMEMLYADWVFPDGSPCGVEE